MDLFLSNAVLVCNHFLLTVPCNSGAVHAEEGVQRETVLSLQSVILQ